MITTKKNNKNLKTLINKIETKIKITIETDIFKKDMDEILGLKNKKKKTTKVKTIKLSDK